MAGECDKSGAMGLDIVLDENCQPAVGLNGIKKENLDIKRAKAPLKDSTNLGVPSVEVKAKLQSASGGVEGHTESIGEKRALPSSEASHEAVQLDSEGFVIWEDSQPQELHVDLAEEVRTLKAALCEALEENKFVQNILNKVCRIIIF